VTTAEGAETMSIGQEQEVGGDHFFATNNEEDGEIQVENLRHTIYNSNFNVSIFICSQKP